MSHFHSGFHGSLWTYCVCARGARAHLYLGVYFVAHIFLRPLALGCNFIPFCLCHIELKNCVVFTVAAAAVSYFTRFLCENDHFQKESTKR